MGVYRVEGGLREGLPAAEGFMSTSVASAERALLGEKPGWGARRERRGKKGGGGEWERNKKRGG